MVDMPALRAKYFAPLADLGPTASGAQYPFQSAGNKVKTLVDGDAYFGAIRAEVDVLKLPGGTGKFFYFTNWLLTLVKLDGGTPESGSGVTAWTGQMAPSTAFTLDDESGAVIPPFIDELAEMAANDTDVRALIWVSPLIMQFEAAASKAAYAYSNNLQSALSVDALRKKPKMAMKACLNTLAWPIASVHVKMVVCGDSTGMRAYISGLDFTSSRVDGNTHPNAATFSWHDAGVCIEGPGALAAYGSFGTMWNELISTPAETFRVNDTHIDNFVEGTPAVPTAPPGASPATGTASVQVLRTVPQMNFAFGETDRVPIGCFKRLVTGFRKDPWKSAPDGIFAFEASLKKAIASAERYIYAEDQGFWGHPIMDWLHDRLQARPGLKLILANKADPEDGPEALRNLAVAINSHLGLPGVDFANQVAFYARSDRVVMHGKIWIIDDEFFIVGSANAFRRSLYTDVELSVGVIDDNATPTNAAVEFRRQLWGEHCGLFTAADRDALTDLDDALAIWNPAWGSGSPAPASLGAAFQRKKVPFEVGPAADQWPALALTLPEITYDQIDSDSRMEY